MSVMTDNDITRAEVVVDLNAISHNMALLAKQAAGSGAATMAVVKADGYGHGAVPVAQTALSAGATWIGVCSVVEALDLRAAGITAPMLSWLDPPSTDFAPAISADIDLSVSNLSELDSIAQSARRVGRTARVHLKIDTGMTRNGCAAAEWPTLVAVAAARSEVQVVAVWSHLACADEPEHSSVNLQAQRFMEAYHQATAVGLQPIRHIANSAGTLTRADLHFDLVRCGIAVYGLNPVAHEVDLRPAMTFRSTVVSTKKVPAGESVGYGHTWTANQDTTLALVPVGYADGVPRLLSNRMQVWIAGHQFDLVGQVSMDQIVVDCGSHAVTPGAEVVLFGPGNHGEPTARQWADTIGTIDYEIVTGMCRPRVRRRYVGCAPTANQATS